MRQVNYQETTRPCEDRAEMLHDVLHRWKRPFSLIDVGANKGYFGKHAVKYGALPVFVEADAECCDEIGDYPVMQKAVTGADLVEFACGEHYDVVLAMSILHHIADWRLFLKGLFNLGEYVVIEYPLPNDTETFKRYPRAREQYMYLVRMEQEALGITHGWPDRRDCRRVSLFRTKQQRVDNSAFWYCKSIKQPMKFKQYEVETCTEHKRIVKGSTDHAWMHGVNLHSYAHMGGRYRPSILESKLRDIRLNRKQDVRPWNFVLNHVELYPIDVYAPSVFCPDERQGLEDTIRWLTTLEELS
jgi:Methyltransferase domain